MVMAKIRMEFERGGVVVATLDEGRAPKTCKALLEALPHEASVIHAMWAGEEIFFSNYPGTFEYEDPTIEVESGALAMVPESNSFCVFYGRSIPRKAVDQTVDVTVFGKVDDVPGMAQIGKRVRQKGMETVRITKA
jgi:hypothetical protein